MVRQRWLTGPVLAFGMACSAWACNKEQTPTGPTDAELAAQCTGYPDQATSLYILPYPVGTAYAVIQGNCSRGPTHVPGGVYQYSYDFSMNIATPIFAARDGVVEGTDERWTDFNGPMAQANYVWIRHEDGTMARYWHLTRNGALVEVGQRVKAGDLIALSGATALDSAPHLHFDITLCGPITCRSRPVVFRNTRPHPNGLQVRQFYIAEP